MIKNAHANILCVKGKGPREAMRDLAAILTNDKARADWKEAARLAAIVGSCPKSMREASSGMRAWICFARNVLGVKGSLWPPKEHDITAWSNMFRAEGTFSNYLGYVKTGCMLVNAPTDVLEGPVVKRAKLAIAKREQFVPREKQFVQRPLLVKVMGYALKQHSAGLAMLFLASYAFMLRVPSEGIQTRKGGGGMRAEEHQLVISLEDGQVSGPVFPT